MRAVDMGLEIRKVPLGIGVLQLMDLEQLFEIGMSLIRRDPAVLLCDDPLCRFCSSHRKGI